MWHSFEDFSMHSNANGNALQSMSNPLAICRLCMLNSGTTMEPIFHLSATSCIADKITKVTRLELHPGDGLPALVCQQCIFQLDVADLFIQRSTQSDKSLRSILAQRQASSNFEEETQNANGNQVVEPRPTSGILGEIEESSGDDAENLSNSLAESNLKFPSGSSVFNFAAVDLLTLPEELILEEDPVQGDVELGNDLPTVTTQSGNLDRHLICSDPLLDVKQEAILETGSHEENEETSRPIKVETVYCIPNFEDNSNGFSNEGLSLDVSNHSIKTEAVTGILNDSDMRGAENEPCTQNSESFAVITGDKNCEPRLLPNQKQLQSTAKKHPCVICSIELANRWSLIRHMKIHKRKERLEKIRLANLARNVSSPIHISQKVSPIQKLPGSHNKDLVMSPRANIAQHSDPGNARRSACALAKDAEKHATVLHKKSDSLETSWRHRCTSCSATFSRKWSLVQHRELHGKKISRGCTKKKSSSNTKQPFANLETNQLNMTPIVRVTPLIITNDFPQIVNSLQQYTSVQSLTFSDKQSLTGHIEVAARLETMEMQKSAGDDQQVYSSSTLHSKKVPDTEIEWDYHKKIPSVDTSTKTCGVCNFVCRNKSRLQRHMRSHTGEKPFKCMICNKGYQELHGLKRHIKNHTEEREFKCEKCYSSFHTPYQLKCHENSIHKKARVTPKKCSHCGKTLSNNWSLKQHLIIHSDARPWGCGKCDAVFKHRCTLLRHQRRLNHECKNRTVQFYSKVFLKDSANIRRIIDLQGNMKKTPKQQQSANNFKGLPRNIQTLQDTRKIQNKGHLFCNNGVRSHKCETCGRAFAERSNLKRHFAVHSKERPWKCAICGFTYKYKTSLKKHEQSQHLHQIFSALELSKKPNLERHIQINGTRTLSADHNEPSVQSEESTSAQILSERTNLNLNPHRCATCGKAFRSIYHLKRHSTTHSLERLWKCDQCNSAFKGQNSLVRHVKVRNHKSKIREKVLQAELCISKDADLGNQILEDLGNTKLSEIPNNINTKIYEDIPQFRAEILPGSDIIKQPKIHEDMHASGYTKHFSTQEATALSDLMIPGPLEPINVECSPQIMSEILTHDHHVKHSFIDYDMKESSNMERPPQDTAEPSDNNDPEEFKPIIADCSLEIRSEIFPENNLTNCFNIHEQIPLSSLEDANENAKVINSETHIPTVAERSKEVTIRSEILAVTYEPCGVKNDSTFMKPFLLQEATTKSSENFDTKTHKPTIAKCSSNETFYDNKVQGRAEPELLVEGSHLVEKVSVDANQLDFPSSPQQTIDFKVEVDNNNSNTVSATKNLQEDRQISFHCKHCDNTYRYLDELTKHMGCHSKKRTFHCSQCSVTVYRKRLLRDHIISCHTTINRKKCAICAMDFKTNFALAVHTLTHSVQTLDSFIDQPQGSKEAESMFALPPKKCNTKEEIKTSHHKDPEADKSHSSLLLKALAHPTENHHVERFEASNNQRSENTIHPPIESLAKNLELKLSDQVNQVAGNTREHKAETSIKSKGTDLLMEGSQEEEVNSLNLDHSSRNSDCLIGDHCSQEQVANVKNHSTTEKCKEQMPFWRAQSGEERSLSVEEKANDSLYLPGLNSVQDLLQHSTSLKSNPKYVTQKNDVVNVGFENVLIPGNADTKNASLIVRPSGTAQLQVPHFVFTFLGTEFKNKNKQSSVESKYTPVNMQDFLCNICGKKYLGKALLQKHLKSHIQSRKRFVCQGCNRSFIETGSMGCKCLNS